MESVKIGKEVFQKEIETLKNVSDCLDKTFDKIVKAMIDCKGKVIWTGMGKSGHVARKNAATASSLGIPSLFMHPGEAMHGDLGLVQKQDMVIAISYSGESDEIKGILPNIRMAGAKLVGITCNPKSTLAKSCEIVQIMPPLKEACHLGLAPTCSTTAVLAYGDALSVTASQMIGFGKRDFGMNHPAGSLGKKLIVKVSDIMTSFTEQDYLKEAETIQNALIKMCKTGKNFLPVFDEFDNCKTVVGCDDLEKALNEKNNVNTTIGELNIKQPSVFVLKEDMAIDALLILSRNNMDEVLVKHEEFPVGVLKKKTITDLGIYI